jgi:uncharacterized membrane protein YedE/YeeE
MKNVSALLSGLLFGLGIAISGMANPAKVLNFFDVAGTWDPSLAFVMGGALITAFIGYRIVFGASKTPLLEPAFSLPTAKNIDRNLIGGSALFGVGWGIAGFCPGGAIPALGFGGVETLTFVAAMTGGLLIGRTLKSGLPKFSRA